MPLPEIDWLNAEIVRTRGAPDYAKRLRATLFPQQLDLIFGTFQRRVACCSRRAGKTQGLIRGMLLRCLEMPNSVVCYFGHTKEAARKTVWDVPGTIPDIIKDLGIDGICSVTGYSVKFKNGSVLWVAGCDTMADARYWKGFPFSFAIVDEAQDWEEDKLCYMVDVALMPSLMDRDGEIALCGVPSPRCEGLFYEVSNGIRKDWHARGWTCFDNPHIGPAKARVFIDRVMKDRGLPESDPIIQREYFGRWVRDTRTQLYHYQPGRNDYIELPNATQWDHVLGIDYGSRDLTTFVLDSYRKYDACIYTQEAYGEPMAGKASITRVVEIIHAFQSRFGQDIEIVADSGALGLFISDQLRNEHGLNVLPAKKVEKAGAIRFTNDRFRLGLNKLSPQCEELKAQLLQLQIDPKTQIEKPNQPCDFADAKLYADRHCYSYLAEPEPDRSPAGLQKDLVRNIIARRTREINEAKDDGYAERRSMRVEEY